MTDSTNGRPDDITSMPSEPLPGADSAANEAERVAALVEQLAREASENKDKLLRSLAEMENMRRRTERQVADAREYGITAFARDVLAVADNMNRALSAIDPQLRQTADAGLKSLLEGGDAGGIDVNVNIDWLVIRHLVLGHGHVCRVEIST